MKEVCFSASLKVNDGVSNFEIAFEGPVKLVITDDAKNSFFFTIPSQNNKRVPATNNLELLKKLQLEWKDGSGSMSSDGLRARGLSSEDFEKLKSIFRVRTDETGKFKVEGLVGSAPPTTQAASTKSARQQSERDWHGDDEPFSNRRTPPPHPSPKITQQSFSTGAASASILKLLTHSSENSSKPKGQKNPTNGFADPVRPVTKAQSEFAKVLLNSSNRLKACHGGRTNQQGTVNTTRSAAGKGINVLTQSELAGIRNLQKAPDVLKKPSLELYKRSETSSFFPKSSGNGNTSTSTSTSSSSFSSSLSSSTISSFSSSTHIGNRFEGMRNLGNTCYMGSVAQALLALPGLVDDLSSPFWEVGAKESVSIIKDAEKRRKAPTCLNELVQLVRTRKKLGSSATRMPSDLSQLKRAVESHSSQFSGFSQQDAHEFLCTLMDAVHDEGAAYLKTIGSAIPARTPATNSSSNSDHTSVESIDDEVIQVFPDGQEMQVDVDLQREQQGGEEVDAESSKRQRVGDEGQALQAAAVCTPLTPCVPVTAKSCLTATPGPSNSHQLSSLLPTLRNMHAAVKVTLTCLSCNTLSDPRTDLYRDFSLDLDRSEYSLAAFKEQHKLSGYDRSGGIPLEILLEKFFAPEERSLSCSRCENAGAMACARSSLTVLPRVLVLHLKRFRCDPRTRSFTKMLTPVKFGRELVLPQTAVDPECEKPNKSGSKNLRKSPIELMNQWQVPSSDGSPLSPSNLATGPQRYALSAVVRHFGSTAFSGHYMCDIKSDVDGGKWTRCDDSSMYPVKEEEVFEDKITPYILFFSLISIDH